MKFDLNATKIAVVLSIIASIIVIYWYFSKDTDKDMKGLGKARRTTKSSDTQAKIDFNKDENASKKTKLKALREVINARAKQEGELLRYKQDAQPYHIENANEYHKRAKQAENYLNNNYTNLKGAKKFYLC